MPVDELRFPSLIIDYLQVLVIYISEDVKHPDFLSGCFVVFVSVFAGYRIIGIAFVGTIYSIC